MLVANPGVPALTSKVMDLLTSTLPDNAPPMSLPTLEMPSPMLSKMSRLEGRL